MQTQRIARLLLPGILAVLLMIAGWAALPAAGNTYAAQVIHPLSTTYPRLPQTPRRKRAGTNWCAAWRSIFRPGNPIWWTPA